MDIFATKRSRLLDEVLEALDLAARKAMTAPPYETATAGQWEI